MKVTHSKEQARKYYLSSLMALIPFLILLWAVVFREEALTALDYRLGQFFYQMRSESLTPIVIAVTRIGDVRSQVIWTTLAVLFFLFKRESKYSQLILFVMVVGASSLNHIVKQLVGRIRPTEVVHLIKQGGYSFPSGHAMGAMIFFGTLLYILWDKKLKYSVKVTATILLSLLILSIACSRVYLGVHFVSDIIAGLSLGLSFILLVLGRVQVLSAQRTGKYW